MPPTPSQIALASHLLRGRESPIASCNHEVTGHPQKAPFRLRSRLVSEPHINLETAVFHHSRDVEDTGTGDGISDPKTQTVAGAVRSFSAAGQAPTRRLRVISSVC